MHDARFDVLGHPRTAADLAARRRGRLRRSRACGSANGCRRR
jgi:hypothetical protein